MLIVPPPFVDELSEILERIRAGERVRNFETVRVTKDGRLIDVALSISPIRDAAGSIVGASAIARDITERQNGAAGAERQRSPAAIDSRVGGRRHRGDRRARAHRKLQPGGRTPVRLPRGVRWSGRTSTC